MKLLRFHIITADTCGGLLDDFDLWLRGTTASYAEFDPLCLIGPNGTGKSQFLQALVEAFQSVFLACVPEEERAYNVPDLQFEIEYLIRPEGSEDSAHVRIERRLEGKRKQITVQRRMGGEWKNCSLSDPATHALLPKKIIGYTSGDNETFSLPFLVSRSGYADEVRHRALNDNEKKIPDTRLMLIDYGTNLEVLVANLLLGEESQRHVLLANAQLCDLHSFRCIIQLAHSAVPKLPSRTASNKKRKGVQLTDELEGYIDHLKQCATCYDYEEKTERYVFDFLINEETRTAFQAFWKGCSLDLYSSFHKLAMLNDLAIPKDTRDRFKRDTKRRFASRLPEPQDEEKVFRFERVRFTSCDHGKEVDYVSLSDGEHQLAQLLGTFCMVSFDNVLFLLDEPESHFNPQWRVEFISKILEVPTNNGRRKNKSTLVTEQDCLLTTHAPFVPSDMPRDKVLIFSKDQEDGKIRVRRPNIETYGTTFDDILAECFGVRPPISVKPRQEIEVLMESKDPKKIKEGIDRLGFSVEKVALAEHLREVADGKGE